MKKRFILSFIVTLSLAMFAAISAKAQATFTSTGAGGNWNAPATWIESGPDDPDNIPDANDIVIISNATTVNISAAGAACLTLTLNGNGIVSFTSNNPLTVNGNLTMDGTSQITSTLDNANRILTVTGGLIVPGTATNARIGAANNPVVTINGTSTITGTFSLLTNARLKRFDGAVTVTGSWTSTAVSTTNLLEFRNGVSSSGTFAAGSATFSDATTNAQTIGGTGAMSFANVVTLTDGTIAGALVVTNSNTNTVSILGTAAAQLTGSASAIWRQGAGSTLAYSGSTITNITLDASTNLNTVNYTAAAQTVSPVAYSTLGLSGSGAKTMTGVTTIGNNLNISGATTSVTAAAALTIGGNFTLTSGTFVAGAFTHNISGNWTKNGGTFTNTGSTINFIGSTPTIGGANPSLFNNLNIANGTQVNLGGLTAHTANRLTLGGRGQSAGTWGGTGSGATNIGADYFAPASGRITVAVTGSANVHYQENFSGSANGATSSVPPLPPWSVTQFPSGGTFSKQQPGLFFGADGFEINNTGANEGVWETADLDIPAASNFSEIYINLDVYAFGITNAADYVDVSYVWDAQGPGSEVLIQTVTTTTTSPSIFIPVAGHSKIRLVLRAKENTPGNILIFFAREYAIANINILGIRNLYSRANTAWATSGTWSTVGIGGVDCACTPSALGSDRIFIGGNTVTLGTAGVAASVTINGTADVGGAGTLQWTGNFDLSTPLENGSITVNNGGTMNGGGFANSRITYTVDATQSITNNGTISVGDLVITGSAFDAPTISLSGSGSTTLTDALSITGATSVFANVNAVFTNNSTGAFTVTGTTTLNEATYMDTDNTSIATFIGNVALSNGAVFNSTAVTTTGNLVFRGGIANGATFNAGGATFNTNNQTLTGTLNFGNVVAVNTPTVITNNGTVTMSNTGADVLAGTGTWNQGATGTLNYAGSTLTVSAFDASVAGNTVNYNSSVPQTIKTPSTNYYNLTLDNSSATIPSLSVSGDVTVTNMLNFNNGIVDLAGNTFTLGTAGAASDLNRTASTTTRWMYGGPFRRFWFTGQTPSPTGGNLYGLFPLGHSLANSYRPVAVTGNANVTTAGSVTFEHVDASSYVDLSPVYNDAGTDIVRKHNAQFIGAVSGVVGGGANMIISVTMTGLANGVPSEIRLAVSNGATTVTNVGAHVANSGTANNPTVGRNNLVVANLNGDFRITSINSTSTPLPIELVSFKGEVVKNTIQLNWETATELNNDFFTVERSADGEVFSSIGQVDGGGTTNQGAIYSLVDHNPIYGTGYYRLRQTDFDGTFTFSKVVAVTYDGPTMAFMNVFPNPTSADDITIEIKGFGENVSIPVIIIDPLGKTRYTLEIKTDATGYAKHQIILDPVVSNGMYVIKAGPKLTLTRRLVVSRSVTR